VAVPTVWDAISYTYDPAGRRIAKAYDDTTIVKYRAACPELAERDGDHCIAEYDSSDQLLRKFIHGPCVDEPICMIEVGESPSSSKVRAVLRLSRKPGLRLWARPPEFRRNRWGD